MQKLLLSIPQPCHENWQQMTPTEKGRFCNACAKEVVDFSVMTDMQVLNYFTNYSDKKVCGRMLPEQLDRTISRPVMQKRKLVWYWNYLVMFLMFFIKGNGVKAQGALKPVTEINPVKQDAVRIKEQMMTTEEVSHVLKGKVSDIDGNPVSFASIYIKGTKSGVSADANGEYSIKIKTGDILVISAVAFKSTEIKVGYEKTINSVLINDRSFLAGEIAIVYKNCWGGENGSYYGGNDRSKHIAILLIKDEATGRPIANAELILKSSYNKAAENALTNKKGLLQDKADREL